MSFKTVCPGCDSELTAPDALLGKRVKCKNCGDPFTAKPMGEDEDERPAKSAAKARSKPARDEEDDERPRKSAKARRPADDDDEDEEDEPRPKAKKKGTKKKKEGLPMALVLGIIGGLLLIGGGVVAYFGFIKEDKPTDPPVAKGDGPPNRGQPRGGGPGGPGMPGVASAGAAWVEQYEEGGHYRIKFPAAPQTQNAQQQTPAGPVTLKVYLWGGPNEAYVATHQVIPERGGLSDDQLLDLAIEAVKNQGQGATVVGTNPITYQSFPGREVNLNLTAKKGAMIVRVILAKDRIIAISAVGENPSVADARVKMFFESLKIE